MLGSALVTAVVAVKDLERARAFYGGTLGLAEACPASSGTATSTASPTRA